MVSEKRFQELMESIGLPQAAEKYDAFALYAGLLVSRNSQVNLTAITDDEGIAVKHFADSLLPLTMADIPEGAAVIDVGSGAGFPSVPIKLVRPDIRLTLLDPLEKRLVFLRELLEAVGSSAETLHLRAEQAGADAKYRERYDVAVCRAVASMPLLAEYCLPLLKVGGTLLALKGADAAGEAASAQNAFSLCGGRLEQLKGYSLPNGDGRSLVIVSKMSHTPAAYPRKTARIARGAL